MIPQYYNFFLLSLVLFFIFILKCLKFVIVKNSFIINIDNFFSFDNVFEKSDKWNFLRSTITQSFRRDFWQGAISLDDIFFISVNFICVSFYSIVRIEFNGRSRNFEIFRARGKVIYAYLKKKKKCVVAIYLKKKRIFPRLYVSG